MNRLALLLPLLALAAAPARAADPATNAPEPTPFEVDVLFVEIPDAAFTNGTLRAAFGAGENAGLKPAGKGSAEAFSSVLDAEAAAAVLDHLTNAVGGRVSRPRKSDLRATHVIEFVERSSILFRTKRTGAFTERFVGTYLYLFPPANATPGKRRVSLDLQFEHTSPPSPETAPDADGFCEKTPFFAHRSLQSTVETEPGFTTFFCVDTPVAKLKPSETRPPLVVLTRAPAATRNPAANEPRAESAEGAETSDAGRTIAGFVAGTYDLGKVLTEDEVVRICRAVRTGKRIGHRPPGWYLPPIIEDTDVFVRRMKDVPGAFSRQYHFSTNYRYVQILSGFVPFAKEYDVETMYFQLDEAAREEIAHICNPFRTEDEEKAYHFDGTALEFVPDWRSRLEPWVETDATIAPYTNAPAASAAESEDFPGCFGGGCEDEEYDDKEEEIDED